MRPKPSRFLDSTIFLYAFIKPLKEPPPKLREDKKKAQDIVRRIQEGEKVATTVVHISEIANILEARTPPSNARSIIMSILNNENIKVFNVKDREYVNAVEAAEIYNIGINNALAYNLLQKNGITEVYSFDKHFDKLPGIQRLEN